MPSHPQVMLNVKSNYIVFLYWGKDCRSLGLFLSLYPSILWFGDFFFFFLSFLVHSRDFRKYLFNERVAGRAWSRLGPEHWLASVGPSTQLRRPMATHRPTTPGIPGPHHPSLDITGLLSSFNKEDAG